MMHNLGIIFGLLLLPYTFTTSTAEKPTEQQKKEWAAEAEKWKRIATALSGKMGEKEDQAPTNVPSQSEKSPHPQAKL